MHDAKYSRYHDLMNIVARNNGFDYGTDVKPLTVGGHMKLENYLEENKNTTQYVVMFCYDEWREQLELTQFAMNVSFKDKLKEIGQEEEEEELQQDTTKTFDWYMPCKFDQEKHGGKKDMLAYYMVYNYTLAVSNMFTKLDSVMKKDMGMMSLKLSIDNALLEHKALEHGLDYIPKIEQ